MADDFSNDVNTTGQLGIGGTTGEFESSSDSDWFKVSLTAGTTYLFTLTGELDGGGTLPNYYGVWLSLMGQQGYVASNPYSSNLQAPLFQYTAQSSGTYYLTATTYGQFGSYRVAASLPAADDYAANTTTTGTIGVDLTVAGKFERNDDTDWFRFHADAGQITTFTAADGGGFSTPSSFYVYDSTGGSATYLEAQSGFVAGLGGDYFLAIRAGGRIGKYATTMHVVSDDYSADNTRVGKLSAGGEATGKLDYRDDSDRFHLDVQQGRVYTVTLSTKPGDAKQLELSVTDGVGGAVATSSSYADGMLTLRVLAQGSGTYSLNVGNRYGNGADIAYTLKASAPEADDFGGTMGSAATLSLGVAVAGKVQSSDDVDMFKVSLSAGVTYRVNMEGEAGAYNNFSITDGGGNPIGHGLYNAAKFFSYTPTKGGDFYLSQSGGYGFTGALGYTLKVSAAVDDFGANTATLGRLSVGSSTKGELEAGGGDADWYAVSLDAGGYYWFSVDGAKEGGGTLGAYSGVVVRLLDAQGAVLATSATTYGATSAILPYVAATKGTYYVEVVSPGAGIGTYTVKARLGEVDDHGDDAAHATAISTSAKGKLELTSDVDMFKFTAEAGVTYQLVLAPGAEGGISVNGYVTLQVATGANESVYTRSVYGGANQVRLFEAEKAGDYYVKVGTSVYGDTGSYVLSVASLGKDDFPASNLTTAVVAPGAPLRGEIGIADDRDWVKVSLEAGRTYVFDLQGSLSGGGTLDTSSSSTGMTLMGDYSNNLAYASSAPGGEPRLSYLAATSGDYYLSVYGNGGKTGTYTVVATLASGDVSAPHLLSSSIQDGAVDVAPRMPKLVLSFDELVTLGAGLTLTDGNGAAVTPSGYGQALASAVGKTLVIDPHLNLKPGMSYTLSLPEGSVLDLAGNKLAGALSYQFTIAAPVASGTSGDDFMLGGQGLTLDGGAGVDTVYYGTGVAGYGVSVLRNADGSYSVGDYNGQVVRDTLIGVERLLFPTGAIALDIDGTGGQVYRLYQAAFNRAPDSGGLGFWMAAMDKGVTHATVAEGFTLSAEFITQYGAAPSDADFVNLLYQNVLHRAPDADGKSFWLEHLAHDTTRAQALAYFSESPENTAAAAAIIGNGFGYTPYG